MPMPVGSLLVHQPQLPSNFPMATQTDQIALVEDLRSTLESFFAGPDGIIKSIVPLTYIHFIMILSVGFMFVRRICCFGKYQD